MRIAKRAEKSVPEHLVKSFVDIGPLFTTLSNNDNQIIFGRRGTGKTHLLYYLDSYLRDSGIVSVKIDMRVIGSSGGLYSDRDVPLSQRGTRLLADTLCCIHESIRELVLENDDLIETGVLEQLDSFIDQSTKIIINGSSELTNLDTRDEMSDSSLGLGYSNGLSLSLTNREEFKNRSEKNLKKTGMEEVRIHFSTIAKILQKLVRCFPDLIRQHWTRD